MDYAGKKTRLTRRICILGGVMLLVSLIAIVIGAVSISLTNHPWDFPFNAGGAMVAGIPALLMSLCPMYMLYEGSKTGEDDTTGCFDCCSLLMVIWFSITILAICFGFGLAGIYGVAVCASSAEVCKEYAGTKMAISFLAIIITFILFVLSLAIFFTCCCNSATFGIPLMVETTDRYSYDNRRQVYESYFRRRDEMDGAVQDASLETRRELPRPRSPIENVSYNNEIVDITIREQSTPSVSGTGPENFPITDIGPVIEPYSSDRGQSTYADPPPSYDEVMRKEQTSETPV